MAWIPDPNRALGIITKLERREKFLDNSIELFQAFFKESHSPDQYPKRMEEIGSLLAERTGYYVDPEIAQAMDLAILDPDAGVRLVVDRLHGLAPLFHVPYKPDEPEDASSLKAAIHYHATPACSGYAAKQHRRAAIRVRRRHCSGLPRIRTPVAEVWRSQFCDAAYYTVHL